MVNKFFIVCLVTLLAGSVTSFADEIVIPEWRGNPCSTFQEWDFNTNLPIPDADILNNEYGTPKLNVNTSYDWVDGDYGYWPLGEIDVFIPNNPITGTDTYKHIQIQLTWFQGGNDDNPYLPDEPLVAVVPYDNMTIYRTDNYPASGWIHSTFDNTIWPNPIDEWITIKGDILVNQLVIDTICIPEPATIAMLGLGGLALIRKRRV